MDQKTIGPNILDLSSTLALALSKEKSIFSDFLWHYTSVQGFRGVLETRCIWATSIHYLNDAAELQHALHTAVQIIHSGSEAVNTDEERDILQKMREILPTKYSRDHELSTVYTNTYVCSFSEECDSLPQWRAYGKDSGYAIGVKYNVLKEIAEENEFILVPCIYDEEIQRQIVGELVDTFFDEIRSLTTGSREISARLTDFRFAIMQVAPLIKHKAYQEEREWRMVSNHNAEIADLLGHSSVADTAIYAKVVNRRKYTPS